MRFKFIFIIFISILASFLRLYQINKIPHGLYIDEISSGYNGYRILTTGKDEYGISYPLFFKAFGEYKMPVLIYSIALSMAVFGKNEFAVRFPSALCGIGTVILIYFLLKDLIWISKKELKLFFGNQNQAAILSDKIPLIASTLLAISPWHLQFSRAGFDATIGLFLYLLAIFLFVKFIESKNFFLLFGSFFFLVLTLYSYNTFRLIVPLTLLICITYFLKNYFGDMKLLNINLLRVQEIKLFLFFLFITFILILPMVFFSLSPQGYIRFVQTSAFAEYHYLMPFKKILVYPVIFFKNYLSYFSPPFLFAEGDGIGRHTVRFIGPLYRWEFPIMLIGIFIILKAKKLFISKVVLFLLLIAPVSAAFARPSPHLLRSILLVIPLNLIIAVGISTVLIHKFKFKKIFILSILFFAVFEFLNYLHLYYAHYPGLTVLDWGGENKRIIENITRIKKNYSHLVINRNLRMIEIYLNFYDDSLKYILVDDFWTKPKNWEKVLYVRAPDNKKPFPKENLQIDKYKLIREIYMMNNRDTVAQLYEL